MTRRTRSDPDGGWHHVGNRGARQHEIFLDDRDRASFVDLVADSCTSHGVEIIAYCLMGNHFHLVLHCPKGDLSGAMHHFASRYVSLFNHVHSFDGSLFNDRFWNKLIGSNEALLQTTRYVHRNPLELGLNLRRYRWSSYPAYAGLVPMPQWLTPAVPLGVAGGARRYQDFVETDMASDKSLIAAGVGAFAAQERAKSGPTLLEPIDDSIAKLFGVPRTEVRRAMRGRRNTARMAAVLVAVDRGADTNDIAAWYNVSSPSGVRVMVSRARRLAATDPAFAEAVRAVRTESVVRAESKLAS